MLVLHAISGPDALDVSSVPSRLDYDATAPVAGLRVGYFPGWMNEAPATDVDRAALEACTAYDAFLTIVYVHELTGSNLTIWRLKI